MITAPKDKPPPTPFSPEQAEQAHSTSVGRLVEAINDDLAQHYDGSASVTIPLTMHKNAGEKVIKTVISRFERVGWSVELIQPQTGWQDKGIGAPSLIFSKK